MTAKKFTELYPNFNECTIQTFDDNQWKRLELCKKIPVKWIDVKLVQRLNNEWAWIFFSVNSMIEWERNKTSVKKLNSWIVESDSLTKQEQDQLIEKAPIPPSAIVESKKSYHIYYFATDATLENWERINRWLREYYHWDVKICSDTSRVLRMPWFYHKKDPNNPYKITVKKIESIYYTEEEMLKAFPYQKIEKKLQEYKAPNITKARNIWEIMQLQSNRYMLQRLSNSMLVNWESVDFKKNTNWTDQIYVNWQSTSAWLDKNDMIWSSEWWPTWIQRCTYYWHSKTTIYKWFLEYCNDLIPKDFDRTKQLKELDKIKSEEDEELIIKERNEKFRHISHKEKILKSLDELLETSPDKIMKRWRKERDEYLWWIYGGKIYLIWADTWVGKSTFVNQVAKNLASAWVKVTRYSLEDRLEDIGKEEIYYTTNQIRVSKGKKKIEWIKFVNGEYTWKDNPNYDSDICEDIWDAANLICSIDITELDKEKQVSIDDLIQLMHEECDKGTRVFIIDHLHYFQYENSKERMDLQIENAMKEINEVARKKDVAIFLVAHYNSTWGNGSATLNSFKWSTGIKQIANIVIQITRSEDFDETTTFKISKLRWPIKKHEIEANFNISTYEYTFTKTEEQKQKELKNRLK